MDLKLVNGDLAIESGDLVWVDGKQAIAQNIEYRVKTALAESPYDRSVGTPWLQIIFRTGTTTESIRFILEQRISGTPGVISANVDPVEVNASTRVAVVRGTADTTDGVITFEIPVG